MKMLTIEQVDGSVWGVPVDVIARHRAAHYAHEFGGDVERSLAEDTLPLFEEDHYSVQDWAFDRMNWSEVAEHARKLKDAPEPDFNGAWRAGVAEVVTGWEEQQ